ETVHCSSESSDVDAPTRSRQMSKVPKDRFHAACRPSMDLTLLPRQAVVRQSSLLPCAICSQVVKVMSKSGREHRVNHPSEIARRLGRELDSGQLFEQIVHQLQQQLSFRAVVLIEGADGESGAGGDSID